MAKGPKIGWNDAVSQGLVAPFGVSFNKERLDKALLAQLRVNDEQTHIQSVDWDALPKGLSKALIESILYYRGSGCLFFLKANMQFYFLPYMAIGTDCYGRPVQVTPTVWRGTANSKEPEQPWIEGLKLKPIWDMVDITEWNPDMMDGCCVIFYDYTPQYSQTLISRQMLNEPLLKTISELIPFMRTSLSNSVGINGINVQSQDEADIVHEMSRSSVEAALTGEKWIPLNTALNLADIKGNPGAGAQEFLMAYQALENVRKSTHGIAGTGMMQKAAHMLGAEQQMNADAANLIMADRIYQRQHSCLTANSIWGLFMWANSSEMASGIDRDMNGVLEEDESEDLIDEPQEQGVNDEQQI